MKIVIQKQQQSTKPFSLGEVHQNEARKTFFKVVKNTCEI